MRYFICGGGARDPSIHNLFQIADVDSGVIRWVNADLVTQILPRLQSNKISLTCKVSVGGVDRAAISLPIES